MVGITPFLQLPSLNGVAALCQNNDSDRMNARASINIGFLTTMIVQFTCFLAKGNKVCLHCHPVQALSLER